MRRIFKLREILKNFIIKNHFLKIFIKKILQKHNLQIHPRLNFLNLINQKKKILEIGPFDKPCIVGNNVKYADILSTTEIQERIRNFSKSEKINHNLDSVPKISYILKDRSLKAVTDKFDIIFSSHCIEHQPDLIRHLKDVYETLNANGCYYLIIPDKRYCFDYFLEESSISSIIEAHLLKRERHTIKSLIEHRCLTTSNDTYKYWQNDKKFKDGLNTRLNKENLKNAIEEFNKNPDVDVHAWQFTPQSFLQNINALINLDYINFKIEQIFQTEFNNNEFYVILKKNG
jgi:SAM-dependent methyltransferase